MTSVEEFVNKLQFKKPHQFVILTNPSEEDVIRAGRTISHHILICGKRPWKTPLELLGWKQWQTIWQKENEWHYINQNYLPTSYLDLWGMYNYEEFYERIANWLRPYSIVVEIGTFWGRSIAHLSTMLKQLNKKTSIYAIDPYNEWTPNFIPCNVPTYQMNVRNFKHIGVEDVNLIPMLSAHAARHFNDDSIDFVYIDGNHTQEAVQCDLTLYYPKVRRGGIIAGHDYTDAYPGVKEAVDAKFGFENIKTYKNGVWEYHKS